LGELDAGEWLTREGFHLTAAATPPNTPAPFPLGPVTLLVPFLFLLYGSIILLMLNIGGRLTKFVVLALAIYIQLVDESSSFALHKLYILSFGMMLLASPPHQVWVSGQEGLVQARRQSAWPVRVMQATLVIVYFTSGICKSLHGTWISPSDVLIYQGIGVYQTEIATFLLHHMPRWFWILGAALDLVFELGAPLWLMVRKFRPWRLLAGFIVHAGIAIPFKGLIIFSFQMRTLYLRFLPNEWTIKWETRISCVLRAIGDPTVKIAGPEECIFPELKSAPEPPRASSGLPILGQSTTFLFP
jgi:hypothetical protein